MKVKVKGAGVAKRTVLAEMQMKGSKRARVKVNDLIYDEQSTMAPCKRVTLAVTSSPETQDSRNSDTMPCAMQSAARSFARTCSVADMEYLPTDLRFFDMTAPPRASHVTSQRKHTLMVRTSTYESA